MKEILKILYFFSAIFFHFMKHFYFSLTDSVVINLVKARRYQQSMEIIDEIVVEKTFHSFRFTLTKQCVSKTTDRRFKRLIDAIASVEYASLYHLHILLRKPDHLTENLFRKAILETANNTPYIHPSKKYTSDIT